MRIGKDDGDDFRDFVGELLRSVPGYGCPELRDSGGPDGGIDLYCAREALVVECKHVGADVPSPSERVDREWQEVRDRLDKALLSEAGQARPTRNPYRPWADADRPIRRYIFTTSAVLANEQRRRDLACEIKTFFHSTIAPRTGYGHLARIKVEVLDWARISTLLEPLPALRFRWLDPWPPGYAELEAGPLTGFRSFLHSTKLPYLSRDDWQPPHGTQKAWTETGLFQALLAPATEEPVLILIGPGGVGKTRLGLELARRLHGDGWWVIRCDGSRATIDGLRDLVGRAPRDTRLLLFVDYLEQWPGFEAVAAEVAELNHRTGHTIRVIATCRSSYRDRLPAAAVQIVAVGESGASEAAYARAVCLHILSGIGVDAAALAEACHDNFALAAFLCYLKEVKPEGFAAEIAALRAERDFRTWTLGRLRRAGLSVLLPVAGLLAASPFPVTVFDDLARAHGGDPARLRDVLVADRWLERQEPLGDAPGGAVWATFHDVFADVVITQALETASDRVDAIDRLLDAGASHGVLRQTFNALERSRLSESLAGVNWLARLRELERRHPGILPRHAAQLMNSGLFEPSVRLALLDGDPDFRYAVTSNPVCDIGVAVTADALVHAAEDRSPAFETVLLPLLDGAVAKPRFSNMVLRLAFRARPERYRPAAERAIRAQPTAFQTHFLLRVWLKEAARHEAATQTEAVSEAVRSWLSALGTRPEASFVLAPWLEAAVAIKGERAAEMVALIQEHLETWLQTERRANALDAQFVYRAWLDAAATIKGERAAQMVAVVQEHLETWLQTEGRANAPEARFVYKAWLDAAAAIKGERAAEMVAVVQRHLEAWLQTEGRANAPEAPFVYAAWLDAAAAIKGERAAEMVAFVQGWLATWLQTEGRATALDTQFVYTAWLDAAAAIKGERAAEMVAFVQGKLETWLSVEDHATTHEAGFIYRAWLRAKTGKLKDDPLLPAIMTWISLHREDENLSFVLRAALERGIPFEVVAEVCFDVVRREWNKPEGSFLLKHVVKQKALSEDIILAALCWCAKFPSTPDSLTRFHSLLRWGHLAHLTPSRITSVAAQILLHLSLDDIVSKPYYLSAAPALLGELFKLGHDFPEAEKLARIYFIRWLRDPRVFAARSHGRDHSDGLGELRPVDQMIELVEALITLLHHGEFTPKTSSSDRQALTRFCDWVATWEEGPRRELSGLVDELTERFGLPELWNRMLPQERAEAAA
ncbi:MAG TPA: hypothetical protein VF601_12535 [Beijerinckiaceae bacterium]